MVFASLLVWQLSRPGSIAIALAGAGFVVAAFTRLECPNGAAGCGLGGRFDVSGATEIGHWTATTVASILLIADTPAVTQRIGIVVATVWLAVFAGATLVRRVKG